MHSAQRTVHPTPPTGNYMPGGHSFFTAIIRLSRRAPLSISRALIVLAFALPCFAQRDPVLKQIAVPHPYYFREMYLPQLTTGPSGAAWSPDSKTLVFSMAGTLWLQQIDSTT